MIVRSSKRVLPLGTVLVLTAMSASSASAVSSIVSIDFGQPKSEIAAVATFRTSATSALRLYVRTRAQGGPACAPTPYTDPGTYVVGYPSYYDIAVGDTALSKVLTWSSPGAFRYCAWLSSGTDSGPIDARSEGTFTVASPVGAITAVVAPPAVQKDQSFVVTVNGTSEVSRTLLWRLRSAAEPACTAQPSLDPGTASFTKQDTVLGNFSIPITLSIGEFGTYRFCSWVASNSSDIAALGVNETTISVPAPPAIVATRTSIVKAFAVGKRRVTVAARVSADTGNPAGRCQLIQRPPGGGIIAFTSPNNGVCTFQRLRVGGSSRRVALFVRFVASSGWRGSDSPVTIVKVVG